MLRIRSAGWAVNYLFSLFGFILLFLLHHKTLCAVVTFLLLLSASSTFFALQIYANMCEYATATRSCCMLPCCTYIQANKQLATKAALRFCSSCKNTFKHIHTKAYTSVYVGLCVGSSRWLQSSVFVAQRHYCFTSVCTSIRALLLFLQAFVLFVVGNFDFAIANASI